MKKTMKIGFIRDINSSRGRFISIALLMFLSTFTLVGLKLVGPNIRATGDQYFDQYNLADISVLSTYGLALEEQELIIEAADGDVEFGYMQDVTIDDSSQAIRVFSESDQISQYELVDGEMPKAADQIAISNQLAETYPLGSTIELVEKGKSADNILVNHSFTVVGYVNSLEILSTMDLGITNVGTGELSGYAVVSEEVFDSEVYMIARIVYDDLREMDAFLDEYAETVKEHKHELEAQIADLPQTRIDSIKKEAKAEIEENKQELVDAESELDNAEAELNDARIELANAKRELDDASVQIANGYAQIESGYAQIADGEKELDDAQVQLDSNKKSLDEAKAELDSAQSELDSNLATLNSSQTKLDNSLAELEATKDQYQAQIGDLNNQIAQIDNDLANPDLTAEQIADLEQQKSDLETSLAVTTGEYQYYINTYYTPGISEIEAAQQKLDSGYAQINAGQQKLDSGYAEVNDGYAQINAGQQEVDNGRAEIAKSKKELAQAKTKLANSELEVNQGYIDYQEGLNKYLDGVSEFEAEEEDAREKIADGYKKIADAEADLEDLSLPVYTIYSRAETPTSGGYQIFSSLATSVDEVANVFPILLYAVAVLVTYTTMTRYVEDERINTGTLLSLGYSESEIKRKFIVYGAVSSSIGALVGIISGAIVMPTILYSSFRNEFTTPELIMTFNFVVAGISMLISVLCAVIPAFVVTQNEFKHSPASLLVPKPPGHGAKILLERITPIWSRLSFAHKVTARNIFRYKKRMFMTIFGVSGSVALLFTGLALQGSISEIADLQFGEIVHYDMVVAYNDDMTLSESKKIDELLADKRVDSHIDVYLETLSLNVGEAEERQNISMIVADDFSGYVDFRERTTDNYYQLEDGEIMLTERLAEELDIKRGDTLTVNSADNTPITFKVGQIIEMYAGHFIFANEKTYEMAFNQEYTVNGQMINLNSKESTVIEDYVVEMMKQNGVQTVMQNASLITQVDNMASSLNSIMQVLIVLSVLLAVVILYNITNINVNERMRELSTTKVLGYFDKEVTLYIYRETVILSILGILFGYLFGRIIHIYMMDTVGPLNLMFDYRVVSEAFIAPAILIILVSLGLGIIVHNRSKKVDMLEALKSVE